MALQRIPVYVCKKGWASTLADKLARVRPGREVIVKRPIELMREERAGKARYENCILLIENASRLLNPDYVEPEHALSLLKETLRRIATRPVTIILEVDDYQLRPHRGRYEVIISNTCSLPLGIPDWEGVRELEEHYDVSDEHCIRVVLL